MDNQHRQNNHPENLRKHEPILDSWYGPGFTENELAHSQAYKPISEIVEKVKRNLNIEQKTTAIMVIKVWNTVLEPNIVTHAQPTSLKNGNLYVKVDSSVWLSELATYRYHEVLETLQNALGPELIKKIRFFVG